MSDTGTSRAILGPDGRALGRVFIPKNIGFVGISYPSPFGLEVRMIPQDELASWLDKQGATLRPSYFTATRQGAGWYKLIHSSVPEWASVLRFGTFAAKQAVSAWQERQKKEGRETHIRKEDYFAIIDGK